MLTSKQKKHLRAASHQVQPIFQVGKAGVNENMTTQINEALEKRELIKVSILQNCLEEPAVVAEEIVEATDAHIVQVIGSTIILYKESKENKQIELP
ncbi:ribosome assembly RNA-binding protein YhbY [Halobacillus litoralis]|uniref:Ribosome assembly RNA-binding protein YhbY n=1 Tax=Halobacillus litoralis TaxID=45668 RepID=A0A845DR18_9BACI|nr:MULTISPECIES: ribosome assembly RNA-binding protein YhbY [Halobacillus]MCA1021456.1 ribosome assembly RNA-binding protein YhbY [Halobacillus litoralis]MYL19846.1 ribosome assembly RNA-binding protein YhbY [Halobacillus litoralis]MYL28992.1 ribosome assembly RNA-binding protein YhbY [Halobacillus halophilus]MYL37243.1 ribosome assembly RNA-binding protein YhbY [Halobacillus litoralis]